MLAIIFFVNEPYLVKFGAIERIFFLSIVFGRRKLVDMKGSKKPLRAARISGDEQQLLLMRALESYFIKDPTGNLIEIRAKNTVLDHLLSSGFATFNSSESTAAKLSKDTISDLLKLACNSLGVGIQIGTKLRHGVEELTHRLKTIYRLKELKIADRLPEYDNAFEPVARIAADFVTDRAKALAARNREPVVAVGGGRSIYQMTLYLQPADLNITILPTNYATRMTDKKNYDSRDLAAKMHELLSRRESPIMGVPILPSDDHLAAAKWHSLLWYNHSDMRKFFELGNSADLIVIGTGNFAECSPSFTRVYQYLGVNYSTLEKMRTPPVGDVNLSFFDLGGNDITPKILEDRAMEAKWNLANTRYSNGSFIDNPFSHPFLIGYNIAWLRRMVDQNKDVVIVAGMDRKKILPIDVLLKNRIANCLVTDWDTASKLLELNLNGPTCL